MVEPRRLAVALVLDVVVVVVIVSRRPVVVVVELGLLVGVVVVPRRLVIVVVDLVFVVGVASRRVVVTLGVTFFCVEVLRLLVVVDTVDELRRVVVVVVLLPETVVRLVLCRTVEPLPFPVLSPPRLLVVVARDEFSLLLPRCASAIFIVPKASIRARLNVSILCLIASCIKLVIQCSFH